MKSWKKLQYSGDNSEPRILNILLIIIVSSFFIRFYKMLLKKVAPLLLLTFGASDVYATPGWCFYALRPNCRKVKRELSPPEALETPAPLLEKRSSVPGSDPDATTWELPYLPSWAGLPYSTCGGTTKLCPTGYACAVRLTLNTMSLGNPHCCVYRD